MTTTTTSDGDTVDFVIRWERGTIDRFIYTIAVLDPTASGPSSLPYWNRKLIYYFGGGVAIGHYQGSNNQNESRYLYGLGQGYAIAWSTGTKTNTHYNLVLGGETAVMVKSRFVTEYDDPLYTIGLGGSGGGIQQYVYGQNEPGLLDGGDPAVLVPGHGHADDPRRRLRAPRALDGPQGAGGACVEVAGVDESLVARGPLVLEYASESVPAPHAVAGRAGLRRVHQRLARPFAAGAQSALRQRPRDHAGAAGCGRVDALERRGQRLRPRPVNGFARSTWDNVGVQYGLQALLAGHITRRVPRPQRPGRGVEAAEDTVQEGCPYVTAACFSDVDVWSARNINRRWRDARAATPGSIEAMNGAYERGSCSTARARSRTSTGGTTSTSSTCTTRDSPSPRD